MSATPRTGRSLTLEAIHDRCQQDGDCLLWTQAVNGGTGSPYAWHEGKTVNVRRLAYALSGKRIAPGRVVAVTCSNPACLEPTHLSPLTRRQLIDQLRVKGVFNRPEDNARRIAGARAAGKLSMEIARTIRACDTPARVLAAQYGVHHRVIYDIRNNTLWREAPLQQASVFSLATAPNPSRRKAVAAA